MNRETDPRFNELEIRRTIMRMTVGSTSDVDVPVGQESDAAACAVSFARSKKIEVLVTQEDGSIAITRVEPKEKPNVYPVLDALKVGESHLFPFPPRMHMRVRMAASARNRTGDVLFSCRKEGHQIRVTRMPVTDEEAASVTIPPNPRGAEGKYMLSRFLVPGAKVVYDVPRSDHYAIRNSVSRFAIMNDLRIRCRVQDDGSMLVYRVDGAPTTQAAE